MEPRDTDRLDAIVRTLDRWVIRQALLGDPTVRQTVWKVVMRHWRRHWRPEEVAQEVPQEVLPHRSWWLYDRG